jgi:hypothetical protein
MNMQIRMDLIETCKRLQLERSYLLSQLQPFDASHMPMELYELACQARGVKGMPNADILTSFFTADAVELLMKMPNIYFLLLTARVAAEIGDDEDSDCISKASVQLAVTEQRRSAGYKYNLRKRLADLADDPRGDGRRESQIASRAVAGLILVKMAPAELDTIIDNPFYFDPQFVGGK